MLSLEKVQEFTAVDKIILKPKKLLHVQKISVCFKVISENMDPI